MHFPVRPNFEHAPPKSAQVVGLELELEPAGSPPLLPLAPVPLVDDEHPAAINTTSTRP